MQLVPTLVLALAESWRLLAHYMSRNLNVQFLITDSYILIWDNGVISTFILTLPLHTIKSPVNRFGFLGCQNDSHDKRIVMMILTLLLLFYLCNYGIIQCCDSFKFIIM